MTRQYDPARLAKLTLPAKGLNKSNGTAFFTRWKEHEGVVLLELNIKKQRIVLKYDALTLNLDDILLDAKDCAIVTTFGWFSRWRLSMARQVEQNIRDNLNHVPHCCGKAPAKTSSKRSG